MGKENEKIKKLKLKIENIHCESCIFKINSELKKLKKIKDVNFDHINKNFVIEIEENFKEKTKKEIENKLRELGYKGNFIEENLPNANKNSSLRKNKLICNLVIAFLSFLLFLITKLFSITSNKIDFIFFILATFSVITNFDFLKTGFIRLLKNNPSMESLVFLGTMSAYFYSTAVLLINMFYKKTIPVYFETTVFILFFVFLGKYIENKIKEKTQEELKKLFTQKKDKVKVIKNGEIIEKNVKDIKKGEIILVLPGEEILVDGIIVEGKTEVDESNLTGESYPIMKKEGMIVYSGSLNINGVIKIKALVDGENTYIEKIKKNVQEILMKKSKIQNLADKISYYMVYIVLFIAIISFLFWLLYKKDVFIAVTTFSTVLLISCPCALGIAIPSVTLNTISVVTKKRIIVKNFEKMLQLNKCDAFIFDKTGTLTENLKIKKYEITDKKIFEENLFLIKKILQSSLHPVSKSLLEFLSTNFNNKEKNEKDKNVKVEIKEIVGKGLKAKYDNKEIVIKKSENEESGIEITIENKIIAKFWLEDVIKKEAYEVIKFLKKNNKEVIVLTGDKRKNAEKIEKIFGIKVFSEMSPEDKEKFVEDINKRKKTVFIGDGINDSLAMSKATVGVAIPNTDLTVKSGDIVIVDKDIKKIIFLYKISKLADRKIKENLVWAFIYNIIAIPIATGAFYNFGLLLKPEIAALAMSLSSISVLLNSLTIKFFKFFE